MKQKQGFSSLFLLSLPSRGAWIEMPLEMPTGEVRLGRSPRGERG